jgi:alpha-tubulin suppressor-like RCC1 family protein
MDFQAGRMTIRSQRQGLALILMAMLAALSMAIAASAQATPAFEKAWGENRDGQLGNGEAEGAGVGKEGPEQCNDPDSLGTLIGCSAVPVEVSKLSGVTAVAGGGNNFGAHSLALLENGKVMAWGDNEEGELGDGTTTDRAVPVEVKGLTEAVTAIAANEYSSLALLRGGGVVAWGTGFLGNGEPQKSVVPVRVCAVGTVGECPSGPFLEGVTAIAVGAQHKLAVSNGKVVAWGVNSNGQLGNGANTQSYVPVPACAVGTTGPCPTGPFLEGVKTVAAGEVHSLAALINGKAVAWGDNFYGDLGNGNETKSNVPVNVKELEKVKAVAAGQYYSLALLKNGTVMAWGRNGEGELGVGSNTGPEQCTEFKVVPCSLTPTPVIGGAAAIAAGGTHSLALLENGEVMAWGKNELGELGTGSNAGPEVCGAFATSCSTKPVEVLKTAGAKGIGANQVNSYAFGPPPTVTALKPKTGPVGGGTEVTITGKALSGTTAVKFGSTSAASFSVNSATEITAVSPAEPAGTVDVTVTTAWGTSAIALADRFKFLPTVTNVSPNTGSTAGGATVTVTGTGFVAGTTATQFKFGLAKGTTVNCASTTTCKVVSPAHAAGTVDVKATVNKVSSAKNAPADQYTYA